MPPATVAKPISRPPSSFATPGARRGLAGFFVSGLLLAFLGAVLPSWGYHLTSNYQTVGQYFLATSLGILISVRLGRWILSSYGVRMAMVTACCTGFGAILYLAAVSPPLPAWARLIGMLVIGIAAGILHMAVFHAISPMYRHDPSATVNLGGTLFGLGCLTVTLLTSGTFYVYTAPSILALLAVIPGMFAIFYAKSDFAPVIENLHPPVRDVLNDLRSPAAIFFALVLFFQFGNEWSLAGWLPLFLVQRLGISPEKSLLLLALYWLCLMVGRIVAQSILPHVSHTKLLITCVITAALGCLILSFTDNRFGAMTGILFIGSGFAPIYPLVVEKIGDRFPDYHPGFYNGIFSFAFIGGLLAPCSLGWFSAMWDIRAVMILPLFGTTMVLLLLVAIWVEGRLPAHGNTRAAEPAGPS